MTGRALLHHQERACHLIAYQPRSHYHRSGSHLTCRVLSRFAYFHGCIVPVKRHRIQAQPLSGSRSTPLCWHVHNATSPYFVTKYLYKVSRQLFLSSDVQVSGMFGFNSSVYSAVAVRIGLRQMMVNTNQDPLVLAFTTVRMS